MIKHCIKCNKCQDNTKIHQYDENIIYSSGCCFECFVEIVRKKQIEKIGEYCFGTNKPCRSSKCSYESKCKEYKILVGCS